MMKIFSWLYFNHLWNYEQFPTSVLNMIFDPIPMWKI